MSDVAILAAHVRILLNRRIVRGGASPFPSAGDVRGAVRADPRHRSADPEQITDLILDLADRFAPEVEA